MVYFHANAENIFHTQRFCENVCQQLGLNVISMEYAGYGLYQNEPAGEERIKRDSRGLLGYVLSELRFPVEKIILCGRSLGCHFALSLSRNFPVHSVILIAPFSSVKNFVRDRFGRLCEVFIRDSMNNL